MNERIRNELESLRGYYDDAFIDELLREPSDEEIETYRKKQEEMQQLEALIKIKSEIFEKSLTTKQKEVREEIEKLNKIKYLKMAMS